MCGAVRRQFNAGIPGPIHRSRFMLDSDEYQGDIISCASRWCALSAVFTFVFSIPQAIAADPPVVEAVPQPSFDPARFGNEPKEKQWSLIVGGGGIYEPTYEGGDELEVSPVPFVVFTWGDWLEIDPRGITVTALEQNGFSIAGKVGYETGGDEKDDDRLRGIRPGVNGGKFVSATIRPPCNPLPFCGARAT